MAAGLVLCSGVAARGDGGRADLGRGARVAELARHHHVPGFRPGHALHHQVGGLEDQVGGRLLRRRRRHHRLPEQSRHCRRLHVGGLVPGHRRPRLHLGLRRPDLLDGLPGGVADRPVPDRRAPAQPRQVHVRRRRLLPPAADADPHPLRHRHARGRGLLPDRADGGRGQADRAAVRPALSLRRRPGRHPDDRLRHLRRHAGHHLGADHQGLHAAGRRLLHGLHGALVLRARGDVRGRGADRTRRARRSWARAPS